MRGSGKITNEEFNLYFELLNKQQWLQSDSRLKALKELMKMCSSVKQQNLVLELLHRFTCIYASDCNQLCQNICNTICNAWRLPIDRTHFIGTSFDKVTDSSHAVLQMLKPALAELGWNDIKSSTAASRSIKFVETHPHVVIVDEFAGTGRTIKKLITQLRKEYDIKLKEKSTDAKIYVCLFACMESAKLEIERSGVSLHVEKLLQKGISKISPPHRRRTDIQTMLHIERKLCERVKDRILPNLGYGFSESLYFMDGGNTPNNVFPIFWWPWLMDGNRRKTLLHRAEAE